MKPMSLARSCAALPILALGPACSALHVYESAPGKSPSELKGLPFFRKVGALQQTTTRVRAFRAVTLAVLEDATETDAAGNVKLVTRPIDSLRFDVTKASWSDVAVKGVISSATGTPPNLVTVTNDLETRAGLVAIPSSQVDALFDVSHLVSGAAGAAPAAGTPYVVDEVQDNTIADVPWVDYSTTHFVNAITPLFGAANLNAKLGSDGTLSEVSASADATKLADELPIAVFLSSTLIPVMAAAAVGGRTVQQYRLVVSSVVDGYRYVLVRTQPIASNLSALSGTRLPPLDYAQAQSITRKRLSDTGGGEPAGKPVLSLNAVVSQLSSEQK